METNISVKSVVLLIFNKCKEPDSEYANCQRIIDYLSDNFDTKSEEAVTLKLDELFELIQCGCSDMRISQQQFETVLKLWMPLNVECEMPIEDGQVDDVILCRTHTRLSKSLTNIQHQIEADMKDSARQHEQLCQSHESGPGSQCDIENEPSAVATVSKRRRSCRRASTIKLHKLHRIRANFHPGCSSPSGRSLSDSEMTWPDDGAGDGRLEDVYSSSTMDIPDRIEPTNHRRHRRSSVVSSGSDSSKDLIGQLRQLRFGNSQLADINERLQTQLELVEEAMKDLSNRCLNLDRRNKHLQEKSKDNDRLEVELHDVRKCYDLEVESRRRLIAEKVMLESELLATKEHSRSLIDKLTVIEDRLDEKNQLVLELQELLRQQEEMNSKLQQLTGEKDCAIDEHVRAFTDLSESIQKYEEQIKILLTDKETLERRYQEEVIRFSVDSARSRVDTGCGGGRVSPLTDTECQFRPEAEVLHPSPWSLRLELAPDLLLAGDSSPLCDKGPLGRQCLLEMEGDKEARLHSANMLTGLMTLTAGVKTALLEYRHQLEAARNQLQPHNDSEQVFRDELTLSYAARLDEAASLLATSIEQASRCQTRFNCTFDLLMNKIATLQSEKEVAQLRNERLIAQLSEAASGHKDGLGSDTGERMKDEFLTDQLRRERLEVIRLRRDMETLHRAQKECLQYAQCSHCGQSCLQPTPAMMHQFSQDIDALDLAGGKQSPVRYEESGPGRRAQIPTTVDVDVERQDEEDEDADDIGVELNERPQYELPADELAQIRPRYRLSHVGGDSGGSGGGGEECMWSLLEPPLAERRASVFAHSLDEPDERVDSNNESAEKRAAAGATREQWVVQGGSSSRSSTATTSEDDEVVGTSASDQVGEQKRRLHKDLLETRLGQSRSSSTSLLGCSLHSEDLRATPTTTNLAVAAASPQSTTGAADIEMFPSSRSEAEPPGQSDLLQSRSRVSLLPLPSIAVIEPSSDQVSDHRCEDKVQQDRRDSVASTIVPPSFEPPSHSSDSPTTSCKQTSRTPSPNPESGSGRTKAREQRHRGTAGAGGRSRRPNTVTGVTVSSSTGSGSPAGLGLQPETSSGGCGSGSCDEVDRATSSLIRAPLPLAAAATVTLADDSDMADIQETMDLLRDISSSLDQLSSTDLKVRFVEVSLQYRTDRPSAPQRAIDAHYRCAKALANVSQEFGILRHLVKSVSLTMECPNELLSRIKASINVLERCVEYLSAKSEILGAVEEELKMCCIADIMQEYNARLGREKEEFQRKLEEARSCRDSNAEPRELAMPRKAPVVGKLSEQLHSSRQPRRSLLLLRSMQRASVDCPRRLHIPSCAGSSAMRRRFSECASISGSSLTQEAKARFQRAVQNTTLKTSVVRQLGLHSAQKPVLQQHLSLGSSSGAGGSPLSVDCGINQRRGLGSDFGVESGYRISTSTTRFFPDGPLTSEDTSDVMYLKGYNLGFKNARDQALIEVRTRQSEFAQRLENFNDLLEETDQESSTERDKSEETGSEPGQLQKGRMAALIGQAWSRLSLWRPWSSWSFDLGRSCEHLHTYLGRFLYVIMGTVVMLALLLPWLMTPSGDDGADQQDMAETSFSLPIRRRSSTPRLATPQPRVSPTTPPSSVSPASSLFSSLNVVRSGPTTT